MNKPTLSVCCITYNHASYIQECIEGFLIQECNFDVEFLIHDDASTDNTQEIIKKIAGDDKRFKLILREQNLKSQGKAIFPILFQEAKGKYVAMCEGDDYWSDPLKLQKQVDLLESNENISICVHNVSTLTIHNTFESFTPKRIAEGQYGLGNILNNYDGLEFHTSSFVYRKIFFSMDIYNLGKGLGGDFLLLIALLKHGNIYYLKEHMSVYRKHIGGATSQPKSLETDLKYYKKMRSFSMELKPFFSYDSDKVKVINDFVKGLDFYLAELNFNLGNHAETKRLLTNALFWRGKTFRERKFKVIVSLFLYSFFPHTYRWVKRLV